MFNSIGSVVQDQLELLKVAKLQLKIEIKWQDLFYFLDTYVTIFTYYFLYNFPFRLCDYFMMSFDFFLVLTDTFF